MLETTVLLILCVTHYKTVLLIVKAIMLIIQYTLLISVCAHKLITPEVNVWLMTIANDTWISRYLVAGIR